MYETAINEFLRFSQYNILPKYQESGKGRTDWTVRGGLSM